MTALLEITHPFEVRTRPPPRTKRIWFRIVVTDQFNRKHGKRVILGNFG
jgi:hypothetical protein